MEEYKIKVELLSETIFGSGHAIPGSVDLEVVYDEYGFPFMKAKTFKGNLRKEVEDIVTVFKENYGKKEYEKYLETLFGHADEGVDAWKTLHFSDCTLDNQVRQFLIHHSKENNIQPIEILHSLTETRSFTRIHQDTGSAEKGSLRQVRVIRRGLQYEVDVTCARALEPIELSLLAMGVASLRHIGTMRTRGKGEVKCSLWKKENNVFQDQTRSYINSLMEEVKQSE